MEPILKDHGLVLRWYPVTDTSRIVIWFTRNHGRVATLARGSQRAKSWMLGQFDLFYTCEVLFYARAREDLHPLRECAPLERRSAFRRDWRACAGASFATDLLGKLTPPRAAAPTLYQQASRILDLLARHGPSPALLFWLEMQAWRDLGLSPDLSPATGPLNVFDVGAGRVRGPGAIPENECAPISPGALRCLQQLQATREPADLLRLRFLPDQQREIAGHLDRFTRWHLDLDLRSRFHALSLAA